MPPLPERSALITLSSLQKKLDLDPIVGGDVIRPQNSGGVENLSRSPGHKNEKIKISTH